MTPAGCKSEAPGDDALTFAGCGFKFLPMTPAGCKSEAPGDDALIICDDAFTD
jgi:hypothetical protein